MYAGRLRAHPPTQQPCPDSSPREGYTDGVASTWTYPGGCQHQLLGQVTVRHITVVRVVARSRHAGHARPRTRDLQGGVPPAANAACLVRCRQVMKPAQPRRKAGCLCIGGGCIGIAIG